MTAVEHAPSHNETYKAFEREIIACSNLSTDEPGNRDVLKANPYFAALPGLISEHDFASIRDMANHAAGRAQFLMIPGTSMEAARIAQRDLSMLVTSATIMSGTDPNTPPEAFDVLPYAARVLVQLSDRLGVVPRATDENFANPSNPRRFSDVTTVVAGQTVFAESFVKVISGNSLRKQSELIGGLTDLTKADVRSPEFIMLLKKTHAHYSEFVGGVALFVTSLPTETFMELVPNYLQIKVDGKIRRHSGSENVTVHDFDYVMWGADSQDPRFSEYRKRHMKDATRKQKDDWKTLSRNLGGRSLLTRIIQSVPLDPEEATDEELGRAAGLFSTLGEMATFRRKHTHAISKTLENRPNNMSSGGDLEMAFTLQEETASQLFRLRPYHIEQQKRRMARANGFTPSLRPES